METITPDAGDADGKNLPEKTVSDEMEGTGRGRGITLDDLFAGIAKRSKLPPASRPERKVFESPSEMPEVPTLGFSSSSSVFEPALKLPLSAEKPLEDSAVCCAPVPLPLIRSVPAFEQITPVCRQTTMLTTFNEADLSRIESLRQTHHENFVRRHGFSLGHVPFFVKACVEALKEFPVLNATVENDDIVYHDSYNIGVAICAGKRLAVPVLRNADNMKLYEIEKRIAAFSARLQANQLSIADVSGGTFSVANGGAYGAMLSTPLLNPPQVGVLGMHQMQDRPVARDGVVVIRPMMYLALSCDHRIIDEREAAGFLKRVREFIEEPEGLLLEG